MSGQMASESTPKGLLIKADSIADTFRDEVKSSLQKNSRSPRLLGILATSSLPSKYYADFTKKQCDSLGVEFVLKKIGAAENTELGEGDGVEEAIIEANEDSDVDGIMVCDLKNLSCHPHGIEMNVSCRYTIRFLVLSRFVNLPT